MKEPTGILRWLMKANGSLVLQQEWGYRNEGSWSMLEWIDIPTEIEDFLIEPSEEAPK